MIAVLLLFPLGLLGQNAKQTISGYVKDAKNGEGLIGASIFVKELLTGTTTNTYGFYSLTLPKGDYTLVISSVGYRKSIKDLKLADKPLSINVELQEDGQELEEVVVSDSKFALAKEKSGKVITKITAEELKNRPGQSIAAILNTVAGVEINGNQSAGVKT